MAHGGLPPPGHNLIAVSGIAGYLLFYAAAAWPLIFKIITAQGGLPPPGRLIFSNIARPTAGCCRLAALKFKVLYGPRRAAAVWPSIFRDLKAHGGLPPPGRFIFKYHMAHGGLPPPDHKVIAMSGIAGQLLLYTVWPTSPDRLFIFSNPRLTDPNGCRMKLKTLLQLKNSDLNSKHLNYVVLMPGIARGSLTTLMGVDLLRTFTITYTTEGEGYAPFAFHYCVAEMNEILKLNNHL